MVEEPCLEAKRRKRRTKPDPQHHIVKAARCRMANKFTHYCVGNIIIKTPAAGAHLQRHHTRSRLIKTGSQQVRPKFELHHFPAGLAGSDVPHTSCMVINCLINKVNLLLILADKVNAETEHYVSYQDATDCLGKELLSITGVPRRDTPLSSSHSPCWPASGEGGISARRYC